MLSTIVLYEWLRGPRTRGELAAQEELFPSEAAVAFGAPEAALATRLYKQVSRARGREIDLAVAASALANSAAIWTLNPVDFPRHSRPAARLKGFIRRGHGHHTLPIVS